MVEPLGEGGRAHRADAGRGQLDGEGQPVEAPHDLGDRRGGRRARDRSPGRAAVARPTNSWVAGASAIAVGSGALGHDLERAHPPHLLARQPEHLAARGQHRHLRAQREQPLDERRDRGAQVLAVVEHEEDLPGPQVLDERLLDGQVLALLHVDGRGDGGHRRGRVVHGRQLGHEHLAVELVPQIARQSQRQPGLAHPAGADEGQQADRRGSGPRAGRARRCDRRAASSRCRQAPRRGRRDRRGRVEQRRVVVEDPGLEVAEGRRRFEAELLAEHRAEAVGPAERLGGPPAAVQRRRSAGARAARATGARRPAPRAHHDSACSPTRAAPSSTSSRALARSSSSRMASCRPSRARRTPRTATPSSSRAPAEPIGSFGRVGLRPRGRCQPLEPPASTAPSADLEDVAGRTGDDLAVGSQQLAQPGDVALQHRAGGSTGGRSPHSSSQSRSVDTTLAAGGGEDRRAPGAAWARRSAPISPSPNHIDAAEHPDLDSRSSTSAVLQARLQGACSESARAPPRIRARPPSADACLARSRPMAESVGLHRLSAPDRRARDEPEQGIVGEGRLHPDRGHACATAARSSSSGSASRRASRCSTSAAATAPPRSRRPGSARRARRRHRPQPRRGRQPPGGRARASPTDVPGRRRLRPADLADEPLRSRRQHLRGDVRPAALRRRHGDGARHAARRPHRDGQLDPRRSDAGRADPEDQRVVLAAAARGLRQPDDVGRRGARDRALRRRRRARATRSPRARHLRVRLPTARRRSSSPVPAATTGRR